MDAYDLIVIGTGTAAQTASGRVRKAGRSVAVIDHRPFGGTCALRGCDPKKMLVSGAEAIDVAHRMQGRGVDGEVRIDWKDLIAFKRSFTDPVPGKNEQSFAERGIDAFHGAARFTGPDTVAVDGRALKARHILIASGARPASLGFPGAEYLITSDAFMELERLPERIVLVGGGYIAAEFSHIAARAGAKVTVLQRGERMLPQFEPEVVVWLMEKFREIGIDVSEPCLAPLTFASHAYETFHLLMPLYICRRWEGTVTAREGQQLAWVRANNLRDYPMPPADVPLIPHLLDLLL